MSVRKSATSQTGAPSAQSAAEKKLAGVGAALAALKRGRAAARAGNQAEAPVAATPARPRTMAKIVADAAPLLKDRPRRRVSAEILAAAETLMRGRREPTPIRTLLAELKDAGVVVLGDNPRANLSTKLSRDPRFESVGRRGWRLRRLEGLVKAPPPFAGAGV